MVLGIHVRELRTKSFLSVAPVPEASWWLRLFSNNFVGIHFDNKCICCGSYYFQADSLWLAFCLSARLVWDGDFEKFSKWYRLQGTWKLLGAGRVCGTEEQRRKTRLGAGAGPAFGADVNEIVTGTQCWLQSRWKWFWGSALRLAYGGERGDADRTGAKAWAYRPKGPVFRGRGRRVWPELVGSGWGAARGGGDVGLVAPGLQGLVGMRSQEAFHPIGGGEPFLSALTLKTDGMGWCLRWFYRGEERGGGETHAMGSRFPHGGLVHSKITGSRCFAFPPAFSSYVSFHCPYFHRRC